MDLFYSTEEVNPLVNAICQDALRTGANLSIHLRDEMFEFFFYRNQRDRDRSVTMYLHSGIFVWTTVREILEWHFAPGRDPAHETPPGRDPALEAATGPAHETPPGRDPAHEIGTGRDPAHETATGRDPALETARALERVGSFLDFAGGYGRVTRFIAAELGPDKVWSAEINPEAVEFQQHHFGVHAMASSESPEAFSCDRQFDVILVSSLFTHLPRERFVGWMHKLLGLLAPRGILLFSVHDEALLTAGGHPRDGKGGPLPTLDGGFLFKPESESALLPAQEYGSTWVSESFVRSVLGAAAPGATVRRLARGLTNFQDLYVVTHETVPPRSALHVQRRVDGFVEHCSFAAARSLRIIGWVIDRVSGLAPREVQALVDGTVVDRCADLVPRPEVMPQFPDDTVMARGWRLVAELPAKGPLGGCQLVIRVIGGSGEEMLLYADGVESALLRSVRLDFLATNVLMLREREEAAERLRQAKNQLQHLINLRDIRVAALEATIRAMEASRFWKIRDQWFRLKRALRLTSQP